MTLVNCTFSCNSAAFGAGALGNNGGMTVTNSIVANNTVAGSPENCSGSVAITDAGYNISFPVTDTSCPSGFSSSDPKLSALADNSVGKSKASG